jgi:putative alpha-1,2-mannosidase
MKTRLICVLVVIASAFGHAAERPPVDWVDPFIGTTDTAVPAAEGIAAYWAWFKPKHGHLHPGATSPFGLVSVVPYGAGYPTGYWRGYEGGPCSGFTHFQQSGTGGTGTYYNFVRVAPLRGALTFARPAYMLDDESAAPGVYRARIASRDIDAAVTVTRRTAFHRYVFNGKDPAHLVIDLTQSYDGWNARKIMRPTAADFALTAANAAEGKVEIGGLPLYFHLEVDGKIEDSGAWAGDAKLSGRGPHGLSPGRFGLWFSFKPDTTAQLRIAFSFKSVAQARANLAEELPSADFDRAVAEARARWAEQLGRIRVDGGMPNDRTLFYTALYRALIKPGNGTGENPFWENSQPWYVDFSTLWDVYKTQAPLLTTFYPERGRDIANALLDIAVHHGDFPDGYLMPNEFRLGEEQGVDFAQTIIADAWQKRVPGIDWPKAVPRMVKGLRATARYSDAALQYAYASACLIPLAEKYGDEAMVRALRKQAAGWRTAFDPATRRLPPKAGMPYGYTLYEGGPWNYSFTLWHDMPGLIGLYPSRESFVQELDKFFGYMGDAGADLPFEGLNNEADMEVPFAYVFAGRPDRTQEIVHAIRQYRFATGRGGWPGNDDSGGTSSWYVWNALGLFPLVGRDIYLIGTPQFPRATFEIGGKSFTIEAVGVSPDAYYVQSAELDGRPLDRAWLRFDELAHGGHLVLRMGTKASEWGAAQPPP